MNVIISHVVICMLLCTYQSIICIFKKGSQLHDCILEAKLQNTYYECHFNHVNFCKINKVTLIVSVSWLTVGTGALPLESVVHRLWEAVTGSRSSCEVFHWMQTTTT